MEKHTHYTLNEEEVAEIQSLISKLSNYLHGCIPQEEAEEDAMESIGRLAMIFSDRK